MAWPLDLLPTVGNFDLPSIVGNLVSGGFLFAATMLPLALAGLALLMLYRKRAIFTIQRPDHGKSMWGVVAIPEGERWSACNLKGELSTLVGPKVVRVLGTRLVQLKEFSATHAEYIQVQFLDGRTEIVPGPGVVYRDLAVHKELKVLKATNLTDHEVLVVYRQEGEEGAPEKEKDKESSGRSAAATTNKVSRALVYGPCLHVPKNASEWIHEFCWHGSDARGDPARKIRSALRFTKLRTCPDQTYYDVEGVRTKDDALVTVKLMIFFRLREIDTMLRETHDPMADFINAVSSDVIDFVARKNFDEFKEATEELNNLSVYKQLTSRATSIGYAVTKVVFRGYGAPTRLQQMHDDAIARRTELCLEVETEKQEQSLLDMKLEREEQRLRTQRKMEQETKEHERDLQKKAFDAEQEQVQAGRRAKLAHLQKLHQELGVSGDQLAQYLLAIEQGPPAKLIQINAKEPTPGGPGFIHLAAQES